MTCEQAWQQYIDANNEAVAAEKHLQDFSTRFVGMPPRKHAVVSGQDFETWERLEEGAARARQRSLEKLREWGRKAAIHRESAGRRRRGDKAVLVEEARREFTEAKKEWVAAQRRLLEFERQMRPTESAPAEAPPVGSRGWETWNRLHEEETAARERAMDKQKAYAAAKARR
jgi:hypothetical protein